MKAICFFILSLCFFGYTNAAAKKACSVKAQVAAFSKKNVENRQVAFELISNTNIVTPHVSSRSLGDGKATQNLLGFKVAAIYFHNNYISGPCLLKAYLSQIYPTHTSW
ncbi:MAG: hypothetical protein QM726_13260 [Chitinophagaceae bacterium]